MAPCMQGRDMINMQVTPALANTDSNRLETFLILTAHPGMQIFIWHCVVGHSPEPYSLLQDINGWPTSPGRSDGFSVGSRQGSLTSIGESGGGWGSTELSGILNAQVTRQSPPPPLPPSAHLLSRSLQEVFESAEISTFWLLVYV